MPGRSPLRLLLFLATLALACGPAAPRAAAQLTTAQQATMPSVVGLTEAQARSRLQQFQMTIDVTRVASAQPEGTVVSQRPGPGTAVKTGARAVLSVSRGPDREQE